MMRSRSVSTRRRRAYSTSSTPQKKVKDKNKEEPNRQHKRSVQWASEVAGQIQEAPIRKCKSDGFIDFDKALSKLSKVSSMLDRSATLEKDFEENLQSIQEKLNTGIDFNIAED